MFHPSFFQRIGAVCGFLMPVVVFGCIGAAIALCSEFSWFNDSLSDLGIAAGVSAIIFNFGLVVAGLLCFFFSAAGLFNYFKNSVVGRAGSVIFAAVAVWLAGIGIFNENLWTLHLIVTVLFFVTLALALFTLTVALYRRQEVQLARFTLISAFVAAAPWVLYVTMRYAPDMAIPEIISAFVCSFWIVVLSYKMFKTAT